MKRTVIVLAIALVALPRIHADTEVQFDTRQTALVIQDTRFDPAVQLHGEIGAGLGFGWDIERGIVRAAARVALGTAPPTAPTAEGVIYRGIVTRSLILSLGWVSRRSIAVEAAVRGTLASYELTSRLFLVPGIEVAPGVSLPLRSSSTNRTIGPQPRIDWSLPILVQFRRDLTWSVGVGVRGRFALEFPAPESYIRVDDPPQPLPAD